MNDAIRMIEDEHRSIAAVLDGMRHMTRDAVTQGIRPNFRVLYAMLDYIVAFAQELHHPKEDGYLFSAIRACTLEANALLDELRAEHKYGDELISELRVALMAAEKGEIEAWRKLNRTVEQYADFHWKHMRREEDIVFPLAERVLSREDWRAVAAAFRENDDPTLGAKPKEALTALFRRVLLLTPAPLGLGPATPTTHRV
jgi:hemerythrin-like domain-containing protein